MTLIVRVSFVIIVQLHSLVVIPYISLWFMTLLHLVKELVLKLKVVQTTPVYGIPAQSRNDRLPPCPRVLTFRRVAVGGGVAGPSQRAADDGSQSGGSGQPGGDANRARGADRQHCTFRGVEVLVPFGALRFLCLYW